MNQTSKGPELDVAIRQAKDDLRAVFGKQKDVIIELGRAFEKLVSDPESICEELKIVLKEEIASGLISTRSIERHCPDRWKKKTKPKGNKNGKSSFSGELNEMTLAVATDGTSQRVPVDDVHETQEGVVKDDTTQSHSRVKESDKSVESVACKDHEIKIEQLQKALEAATHFASADAMSKKITAVLDLTRFGPKLARLVDKRVTTCIMELDRSGKVIEIISGEERSDL